MIQKILHDVAIIDMLANGMSTKQIAHNFNCPETKVELYRARMFKRYGVNNAAHMVSYAYKNEILKSN